jgi:hypothetical protein
LLFNRGMVAQTSRPSTKLRHCGWCAKLKSLGRSQGGFAKHRLGLNAQSICTIIRLAGVSIRRLCSSPETEISAVCGGNVKPPKSNLRSQTSEVKPPKSNLRSQTSEVKVRSQRPKSNVRSQTSEVKRPKSNLRSQTSGVKRPESNVRSQTSKTACRKEIRSAPYTCKTTQNPPSPHLRGNVAPHVGDQNIGRTQIRSAVNSVIICAWRAPFFSPVSAPHPYPFPRS